MRAFSLDRLRRQGTALLVAGIAAMAVVYIQETKPHRPLKEQVTFDFNEGFPTFTPETIRMLSFGHAFAFGSSLWIRFLLHTPPRSMGENEVSWIYLDLNAISEIDPSFMPIYTHGSIYLSVITEDKRGARLLLEKGVRLFPDVWKFRAYLAYHYQYELGDVRAAAEQYELASKLPGAPAFFGQLAATLYAKSGDDEFAKNLLVSMIRETTDEGVRKRLTEKLRKLEEKKP